jgi:hypothetical protein
MNVVLTPEDLRIDRVWFDATTSRLYVQSGEFVGSIDFSSIPNDDFESQAPVKAFSIGQSGSVVVCRHVDGAETWLPSDLWVPGGFTP